MDFPLVVAVALRSGDFLQINKFSKSNYQIWRFSPNQSNSPNHILRFSPLPQKPVVQVQKYPHLVFGRIGHK
jgi:hypothetical protein